MNFQKINGGSTNGLTPPIYRSLALAFCAISAVNGASAGKKDCEEFLKKDSCSLTNGRSFNTNVDPNGAKWVACKGNVLVRGHDNHVVVERYGKSGRQKAQWAQAPLSYILETGDLTPPTFVGTKDDGHFGTEFWNCSKYEKQKKDKVGTETVSLATFCRLARQKKPNSDGMEKFYTEKYGKAPNCELLNMNDTTQTELKAPETCKKPEKQKASQSATRSVQKGLMR